ncbi:MAG TPA: hypothetical protein VMG82_36850, partial [Candidatus Sulfotelmatobacter sp.]|nr:hypothetical protein [Candidatus Sulfotelmatobacter sp.]
VPAPRRVLVCQFELPLPQFVQRLLVMRRALGPGADHHLLIDTRATGQGALVAMRGFMRQLPIGFTVPP